jgi:glutamyl-tRNA(Gln) amidotransferase subunit D
MSEEYPGYSKDAIELLKNVGAEIWSIVEIKTESATYEGILLPRYQLSEPGFIEIKLESGYNIGIKITKDIDIKVVGKREGKYQIPEKSFPTNKKLPNIKLFGTGGTVASRLDYTTGAVIPAFTPGELFSAVPELADICNLDTEIVFEILSENMRPSYWQQLATKIEKEANSGIDGIVIGHGTDTMSFTSAALSFMLKDLSVPVVIVGSQRSSDRPSSDSALNLINATTVAANSDLAEVVVCMLGSSSHKYGLIHRGTLVRKMHSSVRHTFRTIGDIPLGKVENGKIKMLKREYRKRNKSKTKAITDFEEKVGLVYSYPGITNDIIDFYVDKKYKGIVIAGTGLGHTPTYIYDSIKRATDEGIVLLMVTQCLNGFVGMNVYSTGRELLELGVIAGKNILPEVAYVKLGWVLGQTQNPEEVKNLLLTNVAGEFLEREIPIAFNYNADVL